MADNQHVSAANRSSSLRKRNKKKKRGRGEADWDDEPEGVHLYERHADQDGDSGGDEQQLPQSQINYDYRAEQRIGQEIKLNPKPTEGVPGPSPTTPSRVDDEDEEEPPSEHNYESCVYKIVFFILFLLLAAIGTILLVESYNNEAGPLSAREAQEPGDRSAESLTEAAHKWEEGETAFVEQRVQVEQLEPRPPSQSQEKSDQSNGDAGEEECLILNWLVSTTEAFALGLVDTMESIYSSLMSDGLISFYDEVAEDVAQEDHDPLEEEREVEEDELVEQQYSEQEGLKEAEPHLVHNTDVDNGDAEEEDEGYYEVDGLEAEAPPAEPADGNDQNTQNDPIALDIEEEAGDYAGYFGNFVDSKEGASAKDEPSRDSSGDIVGEENEGDEKMGNEIGERRLKEDGVGGEEAKAKYLGESDVEGGEKEKEEKEGGEDEGMYEQVLDGSRDKERDYNAYQSYYSSRDWTMEPHDQTL